ncbi:hypothetical protein HY485_04990 [Candidatus Woesearchaeota archaeon]|nr:hypothetical protein [Candidatus Woesearchaeota archaeon]
MNIKKHIISIIILLFIGVIIWWLGHPQQIPFNQDVHAHAYIDIFVCGKQIDLPRANEGTNAHNKKFVGIPLLHTHDDNVMHLEGVVRNIDEIKLGRFFDAMNVQFDSTKVFNTSNGDLCNGKQGTWKMYVNGKETNKFRDYVPFNTIEPEKQIISIVFDS